MACVKYLPLCYVPPSALKEGQVGANAYINLITVGPWYASGQQFSDPSASVLQDATRTATGTVKPNTFRKGFAGFGTAVCPN